ncbi:hypothetical protein IJT17_08645, partial [bacterium]|nr:hypothetical protein [bacterium]
DERMASSSSVGGSQPLSVQQHRVSQQDIALVGQALGEAASSGRALNRSDERWLEVLRRNWGRDTITVPDLDRLPATRQVNCRLTVDSINAQPGALKALHQAWLAMEAASQSVPLFFKGDGYTVPCHNRVIFAHLRPHYSLAQFEQLYELLREHGTFDIKVSPEDGLAITTDIGDENREMSSRQWITDTVRTGEAERIFAPEAWKKALGTLAKFYTSPTEQQAFDRCIDEPSIYREGGLAEGVAHIFYPQTLQRDPNWFNNKRLESHGLALQALCQGILACAQKADWAVERPDDEYLQAIANLAAYLMSIDYATAPSAGNWEETPFPGGLTWDTQAIRAALVDLNDLLYDRHYDSCAEICQFRERFSGMRHADIATDRVGLIKAIDAGSDRVRLHYMAESPGHREADASLGFLAASDFQLDDDRLESVSKYLQMLAMLERRLVRDNGMIRYAPFYTELKDGSKMLSPDSYLSLNYNIACDPQGKLNLEWKGVLDSFGSKDCSEPLVFAARASLATDNCEAEWFMVSDLARGYANQAMHVLNAAAVRLGCSADRVKRADLLPAEKELFEQALAGATRNINRAYARVTAAEETVKANGMAAPAWVVPEAWQSVSTLQGNIAYLPGVNTPLTWAVVSLQSASKCYMELLKALER